ncbi:MAG: hypothetical protein KOO60_07470 [Gemmatimonadales bacterium]|nr:hypothetical protein [Gemmatimonadales bacterium]
MIKSMGRRIVSATKWATVGLVGLQAALVKVAMSAEESENLFTVAMGKMADSTRKWSNELSKSLGLNAYELRRQVGIFYTMFESLGVGAENAAAMSEQLVQLSNDMASYYNISQSIAFDKLSAGMMGEIEPLKRLGIIVKEEFIKQQAIRAGIIKQGQALNEVQKVYVRFNAILSQTTKAQGDLKRTYDATTNVFRTIGSRIKMTSVLIGNQLLPRVNEVAKAFRDWLIENETEIVNWADKAYTSIETVIDVMKEFYGLLREDPKGAAANLGKAFMEVIKAVGTSMAAIGAMMGQQFVDTVKRGMTLGIETDEDVLAEYRNLVKPTGEFAFKGRWHKELPWYNRLTESRGMHVTPLSGPRWEPPDYGGHMNIGTSKGRWVRTEMLAQPTHPGLMPRARANVAWKELETILFGVGEVMKQGVADATKKLFSDDTIAVLEGRHKARMDALLKRTTAGAGIDDGMPFGMGFAGRMASSVKDAVKEIQQELGPRAISPYVPLAPPVEAVPDIVEPAMPPGLAFVGVKEFWKQLSVQVGTGQNDMQVQIRDEQKKTTKAVEVGTSDIRKALTQFATVAFVGP